jgi:hypothetical protein
MRNSFRKTLQPFEKFISAELIWMGSKYLRARSRNQNVKPLRWLIRKNIELLVNRMKVVREDNSFANESAAIEQIFEKLVIEEKYLVDIGAADGIRQSSTALFLNERGWSGTLFEFDSDSFAKLAFLYSDRNDLQLCKSKVTPGNIEGLLQSLEVPRNFGYLNIDIDSYDLAVLREMLKANFMPLVISMEVNEIFPPQLYFEVLYDEKHSWQGDHFFGCSLAAAEASLRNFGYSLARVEYNNAIFLRKDRSAALQLPGGLEEAYNEGYLNKKDRSELFPWNSSMEFMHSDRSTSEKIDRVNEIFLKYQGKYILKESSPRLN